MELMVTTGAISHAKLQSNRHHQQTNTQLFTGRMTFLSPNQQCKSTEEKKVSSKVQQWIKLWPLLAWRAHRHRVSPSMLCSWGNGYCSIRACQFWHSSVIELRVIIMKTIIKLLAAECCRLVVRRNYTALLCVWFITHDSCCCGGWLVSQCTVAPLAGHWHCCCLLC